LEEDGFGCSIMYKLYTPIKESFDFSYEIKRSNFQYPGASISEFFSEDGRKYLIINEENPGMISELLNGFYSETLGRDFTSYKLDFLMLKNPNLPPSPNNINQLKASTPHAIKVFSTVINTAKSFYSNIETDMLVISSYQGEEGRLPLYTKMIKRLATNQGGVLLGNISDFNFMGMNFSLSITLHQSVIDELGDKLQDFKNEFNIV
jgi:hypothetical protein